ncbi:MAG: glycosyltransferase family A protein [Bacteroidota bacterium]
MPEPRVSVVVPVYNGARYLKEALHSVRSQDLATEVVVVDDGSTDDSAAVAEAAGARVIRQANAGPSAARNAGIGATSAPYLAFLDADDAWSPGFLARLVEALDADDGLGAVLSQLQMVVADGDRLRPIMPAQFGFHFGASLIRRTTFDAVGPIDPAVRMSEDVDWFMRARDAGVTIGRVPEALYLYRQHEASVTAQPGVGDDFGIAAAIKRSLDRRRAAGLSGPSPLPTVP